MDISNSNTEYTKEDKQAQILHEMIHTDNSDKQIA